MKPEPSQEEFRAFVKAGKTAIWQYNTLYQIEFSPNLGNGEYYLREIARRSKKDGMGVTKRGRFMAMTPEEAARFRN